MFFWQLRYFPVFFIRWPGNCARSWWIRTWWHRIWIPGSPWLWIWWCFGQGIRFDFLAGGELRLSCSKSEPKEAFFLSLLDLLGGSFPFSPSFPLFPIRKPKNNNTNQERCCLVSYILVSAFENGCLFILEGKTSFLRRVPLRLAWVW